MYGSRFADIRNDIAIKVVFVTEKYELALGNLVYPTMRVYNKQAQSKHLRIYVKLG